MRTSQLSGVVLLASAVVSVAAQGQTDGRAAAPAPARASATVALAPGDATALVKQYCATCHNDRTRSGNLSLASFDAGQAGAIPDVAEKMIRRLRVGMMPPPGAKRPPAATLQELAATLEVTLDRVAAEHPNPGTRPFQRLNRAEYARSIRDLIGLDIDVTSFLPPDTMSAGFDNVADVQAPSATLMQGYLRAAGRITTLALGDRHAKPTEATYRVPRTASQMQRVDGAPMGTRGGVSVVHIFPADGEYSFRMMLHSSGDGSLFGSTARGEQLEVSINGVRAAVVDINPQMSEADANGMNVVTPRVAVKAGPQRVTAAFIQRFKGPVDDLMSPIEHTLADSHIGLGVTALPHLRDLNILGPYAVTGVSDTISRRTILTCRPASPVEETACAERIVRTLASRAYRGPVTATDFAGLMALYRDGRAAGDFERGIALALRAILASPRFVFRFEPAPPAAAAVAGARIGELELASRLSYFLWSSLPDEELLRLAENGKLRVQLGAQVKRMLADPRGEAMATRFAGQWLRLADLEKIRPDAMLYPYFDHTLGEAMAEETRLLFASIVRDDRSVLDLLTADYTFVNERLARHYGIPGVSGDAFRRVSLQGTPSRRGLLGHGSILTLTSVADRTSPVLRGKWVMEVLLGTPPPPPPPGVPDLAESAAAHDGRVLSVRQRMEQHRASPACSSCHRVIDPLGLALENFDVTGHYRVKDGDQRVDAAGELFDGSTVDGPAGLRDVLLARRDTVLRTFTEYLMTYALGRRLEPFDMPTVRAIVRDAGSQNQRFSAYVMGIVSSPAFQQRAIERADTATPR